MIDGWDGSALVTWIWFVKRIPCEVYSRVVGYFRPVANWNDGKKAEFGDRKTYDAKGSLRAEYQRRVVQSDEIEDDYDFLFGDYDAQGNRDEGF
jgi:hypothetical protein